MDAEVDGTLCRLTLDREELVMFLSVVTALNCTLLSDGAYLERVGHERAEVWEYARRFGDLARAIPYEGQVDFAE